MISIGIPVVKTNYFEEALKSILSQTHQDLEIIILNNGADEKVQSILSKYNDKRIRYYENDEKLPIIQNWNKVLSFATGEYFILFSDDDIAEPNYIEELYNLAQKHPTVNVFHVRVRIIDEDNKTKYLATSCPEFETAADFIWHRIKNYRFHYAPDFMAKTEALKNIGGFVDLPNGWSSDDATWYRLANQGGIVASSKILVGWRESRVNLSITGSVEEKLMAVHKHYEWLNEFIKSELILTANDEEILTEIKKNLHFRISVQQGNAIRALSKNTYIDLLKVVFIWVKFKKKYSLDLTSLGWALSLLLKNIRQPS